MKDWPPQPDELNSEYVKLPKSLTEFLNVLLTSRRPGKSHKWQLLVNSLGQDLVFAVTGGITVTAKHILLARTVKSLTGNVEMIKILNRLGHCICYSKLEELDTLLYLRKISQDLDKGIILPPSTHPCIPTILAFDNIDRLEETLSGGGTSHRVNGIIIQAQISTAELPPFQIPAYKKKARSIRPVQHQIQDYNADERKGPPPLY